MATSVIADLSFILKVTEEETGIGAGDGDRLSKYTHLIKVVSRFLNGTTGSSYQQDLVYSATVTAAASADTYDLTAVLLSVLTNAAQTYVEVTMIAIHNLSSTSGDLLIVGAGSNPLINWVAAAGDAIHVGPLGIGIISSPLDGFAVTASTADILTVDPGANTVEYDIVILGRTA